MSEERASVDRLTSPQSLPKIFVAPSRTITSNPWVVVPVMMSFLALYWAYLANPEEYGWVAVSWPLLAVSVAMSIVAVCRRRYDEWSIIGDRMEVVRDRVVRTYDLSDMETLEFRRLFTGLAAVTEENSSTPPTVSPSRLHVEVTMQMRNGDRTAALLPSGDPELSRLRSWRPSPASSR